MPKLLYVGEWSRVGSLSWMSIKDQTETMDHIALTSLIQTPEEYYVCGGN